MKYLIRFFSFVFFSFLFFSCGQDDACRVSRYVNMPVTFYTIKADTITLDSIVYKTEKKAVDNLLVRGVGVDSVLYNGKNASSVNLLLNKFSDRSDYVFMFDGVNDTISFFYDTHENFLSFECGVYFTYTLRDNLHYSTNYIDSVKILTYDVNTSNAENIQIYHTPR